MKGKFVKKDWRVIKVNSEQLISVVKEVLQKPEAIVKNLGIIGGMTNLNYLVDVDEKSYIVRIPGYGTSSLIDRAREIENLKLGSALGINPELIYFNIDSGMKITEKIEDASPLTKEEHIDGHILQKVARIFKTLHHSKKKMNHAFHLFEMMEEYEMLALEAGGDFYTGFEEVKDEVKALQYQYEQILIEQKPCHIDPAGSNFLISNDGHMYLIDWEYGGMFDPLWDVAAFSLEAGLSLKVEKDFHKMYFGREITDEEQDRIFMHKIFQDYLWSIWTLFKEEKGDNFGLYGRRRFERAKTNLQLYKTHEAMKFNAQ